MTSISGPRRWLVSGLSLVVFVLVLVVTYAVFEEFGWRVASPLALFVAAYFLSVALEDRA